jgi:heat shock protein HslJ
MIDQRGSRLSSTRPLVSALCAGAAAIALAGDALSQTAPPGPTADSAVARTLQDHRWTLQSASDGTGRPIEALLPQGHPIVMSFDGERLSVQGACNQMSGGWRLSPQGQLTVGRMASTMMACETPLMEADTAFSAALSAPLGVELSGSGTPSLRLSTAARQTLTFSGQPTLRSLYGAPQRLFLEVAAQTAECTLPSGATGRCLQVREVRFDDKGLRQGPPGPWQPFTERIEGYTHKPGVRNVLRVDRYQRKQATAGEPAAVYVLDMMVESSTETGK